MKKSVWKWALPALGVVLALVLVLVLTLGLPVSAGLLPGLKILAGEKTITIPKEEYERLRRFQRMDDILKLVEENYIEEPDTEEMITFAQKLMLYALGDPYTNYLTPEDMAQEDEERQGTYEGVGMQLVASPEDNLITVTRVFKNSPAEAAGVQRGDKVVKVNDEDYFGNTMTQAVDNMRGEPGTSVKVSFAREGEAELMEYTLTRSKIEVSNVIYEVLDNNVGYLLLYGFTGTDVPRFFDAIAALAEQNVRGLIIDLRDNPGGYVTDAVQIADALVPEGIVTYTEDRFGKRFDYPATADMLDWPLVLLVNEYSASASEILTGAVKDFGVGKVVGTTTFGKGIVQELFPFRSDGAGLMLTTMHYYTPSGVCIHGTGIAPDVVVEQPEDLRVLGTDVPHDQDVQLQKAVEVLEQEIAAKGQGQPAQ